MHVVLNASYLYGLLKGKYSLVHGLLNGILQNCDKTSGLLLQNFMLQYSGGMLTFIMLIFFICYF